ncbi:hypothetical protein GGQ74_001159 [Desulfobaculum xiamenense]|uniref:VRR-NUC domain-containing protein n=1 Tax=Desulfobaculum xiamenense TaxID=995050 RepID=A0A846QS79_9BACT|nr:VRR-NUC domain-containing protein [Desulfobaculum xiamenense]NJB67519.1 hypothetical protein [Desulfobaculum xiamenense]
MSERWTAQEAQEYFRTGRLPLRRRSPDVSRSAQRVTMPAVAASEHEEQVALFAWARSMESAMPELALLYAIPNGGHRHRGVAVKLKAEGVRAGVPDVHLPVARGAHHGLWIEMKVGRNTLTARQEAIVVRLRAEGHRVEVCHGARQAIAALVDYLGGGQGDA